MFESFSPVDLKFITQKKSMPLQYILSCSFLLLSCQVLWKSKIEPHQRETGSALFTGHFGCGQFYHALQPASLWQFQSSRMQSAFQVFQWGPWKGRLWKTVSKEWEIGGVTSTWLGAPVNQVLRCEEDNFQALWRRRRILKTKKISLEIQAKCSTACEGLSHSLGVCVRACFVSCRDL